MRASGFGSIQALLNGSSVIHDASTLQLFQESAYIDANLLRISGAKLLLDFRNNFSERALTIAALEHLPSSTLQLDRTFGEQDHPIFFSSAPSAPGG
jgi:hypothetical protein